MNRSIRYTIRAIPALILLALLTAAVWLFGTNQGARWLLQQVPRFTAMTLNAEKVDGTLWSGLHVEGLSLSGAGIGLNMREFRIRWQPMMLFAGQLRISELKAAGILITDTRPESEITKSPQLQWPKITGLITRVSIRIPEFRAAEIQYHRLDKQPVIIKRAASDVRLSHGRLSLRNLDLSLPQFHLGGTVAAGFVRPFLRADTGITVSSPIAGADRFSLVINLDPAAKALAAGTIKGTASARETAVLHFESKIELTSRSISLTGLQAARPGRNGSAAGNAELMIASEKPQLHAELQFRDLDLSREVQMITRLDGRISIDGTLQRYQGRFALAHKGTGWKHARLEADFRGTPDSLTLTSVKGQLLEGSVTGSAAASWRTIPSARASLNMRGLNPAVIAPELQGSLNADLNGTLRIPGNRRPESDFALDLLKSSVHGHALRGTVRARLRRNDLELDKMTFQGKGFDLKAQGRLRQGINFSAGVSDLSVFMHDVQGGIKARGVVRRSGGRFSGTVNAAGRNVAARGMKAASLSVNLRLDDRKNLPFSVQVYAGNAAYSVVRLDSFNLEASGTRDAHSLHAVARSSAYRIALRVTGMYADNAWRGEIVQLSGKDQRGRWSMQEKTRVSVSQDSIFLSPLVIASADGERVRLSADIRNNPRAGDFLLAWSNIDLSRANAWLSGAAASGRSRGEITGKILDNERVQVTCTASLSGGVLTRQVQKTELKAEISKAELSLAWKDSTLESKLSLAFARYGSMDASLVLPLPARLPVAMNREGAVGGFVKGKIRETGTLSILFPGLIQESRGELAVDLSVNGTWNTPDVKGSVLLDKAAGYFPAAGIHVKDIRLEARVAQNTIRVESIRAASGPGSVQGKAVVTIGQDGAVQYEGTLQGDRFQALFLPNMQMQVSPDLRIRGTKETIWLRGDVRVPELLIYGPPKEAPVKPSEDVVIVGRRESREPALMKTDIEVKLVLGKRVIIKAEGVDAELGGEVIVAGQSLEEIKARGEISVSKGKYSAYGVGLDISRGRVLFSGPVENPSLDILAVKTVEEVKAGVVVTGTIRNPVVRLYSQPAMTDADILSYMVLGHPLGGQDKQQSSYLMQAAGALLSAGQSVTLQDQVKHRLGLDTIDIQTGSGSTSRSLVTIGKYLSPRLYVSYGRALFTGENLFRLRYKFGKRWELESRTGEASGVDLYYTINFD